MSSPDIPESEVVRRWQKQVESRRRTVDKDGNPVEVVYPGRPNDCRGGDFRDAVIRFGKDLQQGCIEIHSATSGWEDHGHQRDPHYNQVKLHVVWRQDSLGSTRLADGQSVPTIVLDKDLAAMAEEGDTLPCRKIQASNLKAGLESMGKARLADKVDRFCADLQTDEAGQVLFSGVMEALGYSKNKQPFLELARRAPLKDWQNLVACGRLIQIQAQLAGLAGLLPSQRGGTSNPNSYIYELESRWRETGAFPALNWNDWEFYKVRPGNYPVRRLMALAGLLLRFGCYTWLETWRSVVEQAAAGDNCVDLQSLFMVKSEGFWSCHSDFNSAETAGGNWLLGRGRASEIIINVVLPFFMGWSRLQGQIILGKRLEKIYLTYPPGETNAIQRHLLNQLKAERGLVKSAVVQQGLLHLYKTYCTQGLCGDCALLCPP